MLRRRTAGEMSSTTAALTSNPSSTSAMAPAERKATEKSNMATVSVDGDDCIVSLACESPDDCFPVGEGDCWSEEPKKLKFAW